MWTQVLLYLDPYLKTKEQQQKPIPIPIIETGSTTAGFITKPKRKSIIGSVPLFKTQSKSESNVSPTHSKYIHNVLTRKVSHDPTFGVYQGDTNGSFKIGRSSFKRVCRWQEIQGDTRPVGITNPITT
jgi:hypothetical protein